MKTDTRMLAALMAVIMLIALSACGKKEEQSIAVSGENVTVDNLALMPEGEAAIIYENDGLKLLIPLEYDALLQTEVLTDDEDGLLFSISEIASIMAAKKTGYEDAGAGWLFSIGRVDESMMYEMTCRDMSGEEIFAKDGDGNYYVYYHPTDVRFVREDNEAMQADQVIWTELNDWASGTVREQFIAQNEALSVEIKSNTMLDMYLAQLASLPGVRYTVGNLEYGPVEPLDTFDAEPYLDRLTNDVYFEEVYDEEAPDGEYIVLTFPDEDIRFDFFYAENGENTVRAVWDWGDGGEELYKAVFKDETLSTTEIMQEWYNALVNSQ